MRENMLNDLENTKVRVVGGHKLAINYVDAPQTVADAMSVLNINIDDKFAEAIVEVNRAFHEGENIVEYVEELVDIATDKLALNRLVAFYKGEGTSEVIKSIQEIKSQ